MLGSSVFDDPESGDTHRIAAHDVSFTEVGERSLYGSSKEEDRREGLRGEAVDEVLLMYGED